MIDVAALPPSEDLRKKGADRYSAGDGKLILMVMWTVCMQRVGPTIFHAV